jgi:hypothetical protein
VGGRKGGRKGGREEGREEGKEGGREGGRGIANADGMPSESLILIEI